MKRSFTADMGAPLMKKRAPSSSDRSNKENDLSSMNVPQIRHALPRKPSSSRPPSGVVHRNRSRLAIHNSYDREYENSEVLLKK
jgi:hypothetical protein